MPGADERSAVSVAARCRQDGGGPSIKSVPSVFDFVTIAFNQMAIRSFADLNLLVAFLR